MDKGDFLIGLGILIMIVGVYGIIFGEKETEKFTLVPDAPIPDSNPSDFGISNATVNPSVALDPNETLKIQSGPQPFIISMDRNNCSVIACECYKEDYSCALLCFKCDDIVTVEDLF